MRISDWSSDVCSSDLAGRDTRELAGEQGLVIVGARRAQRGVDALALRGNDRGEPIFVGEAEPGGAVIFDGSTLVEVLIVDVEDRLSAEEAGWADMVGPTALFVRVGRLAVAVDQRIAARHDRRAAGVGDRLDRKSTRPNSSH